MKISRLEIPHPPLKNVFRLEAKGEAGLRPKSLKALGKVISPPGPTEAICASPAAASHHGPGHGLGEQTDLGESGNMDAQMVLSAARWRPVSHIISWETRDCSPWHSFCSLPERPSACCLGLPHWQLDLKVHTSTRVTLSPFIELRRNLDGSTCQSQTGSVSALKRLYAMNHLDRDVLKNID